MGAVTLAMGALLVSGGPAATAATVSDSAAAGGLTVTNLDGLPNWSMAYRMVFNRIQTPADGNEAVHDTGTARLGNSSGSAITVSALTLSGPYALASGPTLPFTIAPGASVDLKVRFTALSGGAKGSAEAGTLKLKSDAGTNPNPTIALDGWWQNLSEHSLEPLVPDLVGLFGLHVTLPKAINSLGEVKAFSSDEVLAPFWHRLNPGAPVTINEIASFHTYPLNTDLTWFAQGHSSIQTPWATTGANQSQSVLPRATSTGTAPAAGSFDPTGTFGFRIDQESSDPALNGQSVDRAKGCTTTICGNHVRAFQLHWSDGAPMVGSYLIIEDAGGVNYDYNDNVFVINNVKPV